DGVEGLLAQQGSHLRGVHRSNHFGSRAGQDVALEPEHSFFILDQQDSPREGSLTTGRRRGLLRSCTRSCGGQYDFENSAAVLPVLCADLSAMLLNNSVTDAEAEPRAFAYALGGVERLKNAVRFLDSGTGVVKFGVDISVLGVDTHLQRSSLSGFQHSVYSVVDDVEKHLLQLVRVSGDRRSRAFEFALQLDVIYFQVIVAQRQGLIQ